MVGFIKMNGWNKVAQLQDIVGYMESSKAMMFIVVWDDGYQTTVLPSNAALFDFRGAVWFMPITAPA